MSKAQSFRRFFRTPKGVLLAVLTVLAAAAAAAEGSRTLVPGLATAVFMAGLADALMLRRLRSRWEFPSGAVLSALIVSMILSEEAPWYVGPLASVLAVMSKYTLRSRAGNVLNPAALALVAAFHLFDTGQSWWGALPGWAPAGPFVLILTGAFIADRVDRAPLVLAFLGAYALLFSAAAFLGDPARVAEVFRTPDLEAVLFFAFFMLTDPPTAPVKYPDQIRCGIIVAVVAVAVFLWIGAVYYLLAGVLAGNLWEAWRRVSRRYGLTFPAGVGAFFREIAPWAGRRPGPVRV